MFRSAANVVVAMRARPPAANAVIRLGRIMTGTEPLLAKQEIEIAALLGLGHRIHPEPMLAAVGLGRRLPSRAALVQLGLVDLEIELAAPGVELDHVAVANQRERP